MGRGHLYTKGLIVRDVGIADKESVGRGGRKNTGKGGKKRA